MAENADAKKYGKLLGASEYDKEAAEQLAEMVNEIVAIELRAKQLKQIVSENRELQQYVWTTADGKTIALHNIEDDHLSNIMVHLLRSSRAIPRAIRGEAIKRGLTIPATVPYDWDDYDRAAKKLMAGDRKDVL